MRNIITAREAAQLIPDGAALAVGGFLGFGTPEELLLALRDRFLETGAPRNLTLLKGVSVGDRAERGVNRIAIEGLLRRVICSHVGLEPAMAKLIETNRILAYLLPLGTMTELYRAAAAHRPGVITRVGLETFADPRLEGGKANDRTKAEGEDLVSLVSLGGEDCLYYPTVGVDACFLRGTAADAKGNISFRREAVHGDQAEAAAACHNSGGNNTDSQHPRWKDKRNGPDPGSLPGCKQYV